MPQYDDIFFIRLQVQYVKIPSSEYGENVLCTEIDFDIQNNLCTQHFLLMFCKNKIYLYYLIGICSTLNLIHDFCFNFRVVEKELDRALGEKQKLQMEIEEQKAAAEESEGREAKMRLEAEQRLEQIKVIFF